MRIQPYGPALAALLAIAAAGRATAAPRAEPTASLGVDSAYDSNVYNGRGPDLVTRVTPRLALHVYDERTEIHLAYDLGAWFYAEGTAENSLNHQGDVSIERRLTRRLTVRIADEIIYAKDPGFLLRAGVVAPQTSIFDNTLDGEVAARLLRRLDLAITYGYRHTTFGPVPAGTPPLHDGDQHDGTLSFALRATRADTVRLGDRLSYYTADGGGLALADSPALGWRHQFMPYLESRVEAGPLFYHVLDEGRALMSAAGGGASGITWRAQGLLRLVTPHWRAALAATRDLVGGTGAASVLWADYLTGTLAYRVQRRVDVRSAVGVFANGFAPDAARLYDGVTADASVDVTLVRGLHLGAYYSFRWQEALAPADVAPLPSVTRHIVGLRLAAVYGEAAWPPRHPQPE
jgi:hypothetical protein